MAMTEEHESRSEHVDTQAAACFGSWQTSRLASQSLVQNDTAEQIRAVASHPRHGCLRYAVEGGICEALI